VSVRPITLPRAATPFHDRPVPRRWEHVDPFLLIVTLLLIGYGLVMTYSVTAETSTFNGDPMQFVYRGAIWATVGLAAMVAVALFDYAWLGAFAPLVYVFTLGLLAIVLAVGTSTLGAQRSVNLGGLSFQFSEVAKVLMIIVLAKFFADREDRIRSPIVVLQGLALLAPAVVLVYRQPDLGTSLVFVAIFFGVAFLAGARVWQLTALVAVAIAALPLIWTFLKEYQRARLTAFLDPYADPQGAGWNIIQSLIAVGSGGATGKGLTAGTQSPLGYLPIAESDFVFAGLAEDLGFLGAVILFVLYVVLLIAALRVAFRARDPFGLLVAGGVATMLAFQIVVNVGMAISLMPITGIPLPFISHGGSSLLSICFALGVLQSISMRREGDRSVVL
jgi:rod shape determining protein RodA